MTKDFYTCLWKEICTTLDNHIPSWKQRITDVGQISAIEARSNGKKWTDDQIFAGIVKAVLSHSIRWAKIEKKLPALEQLFHGFDIHYYASLTEVDIDKDFLPWFKTHEISSITMVKDVKRLISTAKKLCHHSKEHGSIEDFLSSILKANDSKVRLLVKHLSSRSPSNANKIPAMGIVIATNAMRNIGFDVAKPERQVNRALGCFELMNFNKWPEQSGARAPLASESECLKVMSIIEEFAFNINTKVAFLDSAIGILCAKDGVHISNTDLAKLAYSCCQNR